MVTLTLCRRLPAILATGSLLAFGALSASPQSEEVGSQTVVFVCEHGSAKSVIAAAYFNRLASEKGMHYRAVARGTKPDEKIDPNVRKKLAADGLDVSTWKPVKINQQDVDGAKRVITLAQDLPVPGSVPAGKLSEWGNIPSVSQDYDTARDDIVGRVNHLIQNLSAKIPPSPDRK